MNPKSANLALETPYRIEPARLENAPEAITDVVAELSTKSAVLGVKLHPETVANLASTVRIMNTYYSNLIEGHNTRPRDIERALKGELDDDEGRRNLQLEAAAHVRIQEQIEQRAVLNELPEPASVEFIKWLHREFYKDATPEMLLIRGQNTEFIMEVGEWRSKPEHDVAVGRHIPPSSAAIPSFMEYFENRFRFEGMGSGAKILATATAHHRFNYIHPFPDGNGRVSRLMSHAMALKSGIGSNGLWSVSRGMARGLESRGDYKRKMDHADMPRQGDRDGRGNLSERALVDFVLWFLNVCVDQVAYMSGLFELETLERKFERYIDRSESLKPASFHLLQQALLRGQFDRGDASRITGQPERTARRILNDVLAEGLLASDTPKGPVSLRFPAHSLETLFPNLYPET